jgi:hypothetical protein
MRTARSIVVVAALIVPIQAAACGSGQGPSEQAIPSLEGGADVVADVGQEAPSEAASPPVKTTSAPPPVAGVRVANWSPDAPPIDLCLAQHGQSNFRGPLLRTAAGPSDDAGIPALPFPYASAYVYVAPGRYDARLVAAGSPDCATGIGSDATNLPAIAPDGYATVALTGEENPTAGAPGLKLVFFQDDAFPSNQGELRTINLALLPSLQEADFGEITVGGFSPLFLGVPVGQAGTVTEATVLGGVATGVDPNGYAMIPPLGGGTISVRARNGALDIALAPNVSVAAGAIVTIAAVGSTSIELVECVDNAPASSYLGQCYVISGGAGDGGS